MSDIKTLLQVVGVKITDLAEYRISFIKQGNGDKGIDLRQYIKGYPTRRGMTLPIEHFEAYFKSMVEFRKQLNEYLDTHKPEQINNKGNYASVVAKRLYQEKQKQPLDILLED